MSALNQKATCLSESQEEGQRQASPFDGLALKLGLPPHCDIDLRRQDELEVKHTSLDSLGSSGLNFKGCTSVWKFKGMLLWRKMKKLA